MASGRLIAAASQTAPMRTARQNNVEHRRRNRKRLEFIVTELAVRITVAAFAVVADQNPDQLPIIRRA